MRDYHINIFWSDEDGGYIADIPDLAACSAFGATPEDALREVQIAKALATQPPLLFMDEVTTGLDLSVQAAFFYAWLDKVTATGTEPLPGSYTTRVWIASAGVVWRTDLGGGK